MENQGTTTPSYQELLLENLRLKGQVKVLSEDVNYLEELVRHLKRQKFGSSSEIVPSGQGTLFNEAETIVEESEREQKTKLTKTRKRGRPIRKPLPESLPQVQKKIDLPESEKFCQSSGAPLEVIGEEVSKQLDIEPMSAKVIVTTRLKYGCSCTACRAGDVVPTMKTAPVDPQPIPKSMAAPGLLAYIVASKFIDAMPLARQEEMFRRHGIDLSRSTMASWVIKLGGLVTPIINLVRDEITKGGIVQADETTIQVRKGTGKSPKSKSYMWAFSRQRDDGKGMVLYELGPSRSHTVPLRVLEGFKGYLHADGYEAYETLAVKMPEVTLVGDWAHVRRKFFDAVKAVPKDFKGEVKVQRGLDLINELFRIDRDEIPKDAPLENRRAIRNLKSRTVIDDLKKWADEICPTIPPRSLSGEAMNYMLNRWSKLILFLDNPELRLDTNPIEGLIRPFVIGRKNWIFADTVKGAEASAALYSLVVMAKLHSLNPFNYLKSIFTELPKVATLEEVEALLPWNWVDRSPAEVVH